MDMKDLSLQALCVYLCVCVMFENRFHVSLVDHEFSHTRMREVKHVPVSVCEVSVCRILEMKLSDTVNRASSPHFILHIQL